MCAKPARAALRTACVFRIESAARAGFDVVIAGWRGRHYVNVGRTMTLRRAQPQRKSVRRSIAEKLFREIRVGAKEARDQASMLREMRLANFV
jgi:hypothetical protein